MTEEPMQVNFTRSLGMILLCCFLILFGLTILVHIALPLWVTGILALVAGFFLLLGI
jgi:hypothetical protein